MKSMTLRTLRKIASCIAELPRFMSRIGNPRIIMTLLVKDEEDIIAANLEFHHMMGVDGFVVTDNNSTDKTPEILEEYRRRGWILEIIRETATGYEQKRWVDRMIWIAKTTCHADWIINADADEFWFPASGSLKHEAAATRANVIACNLTSVYPADGEQWYEWSQAVRQPEIMPRNVPPLHRHSIFSKVDQPKVMHRADGYLQIHMGNHKVSMLPCCRKRSQDITIYHYNYRDRDRFIRKMLNGSRELLSHKGKHGGRHWRYFGELLRHESPEEVYSGVIEREQFPTLKGLGYLHENKIQPLLYQIVSSMKR